MWSDRKLHGKVKRDPPPRSRLQRQEGQALVEYVLIVALVVIGLVVILSLVGPALGNVFSNQVTNLVQQNGTPFATLDGTAFWNYVTAVASYTPVSSPFATFTPVGATPTPTFTDLPTNGPSPTHTPTLTATATPSPGASITPTDKPLGTMSAVGFRNSGDNLTEKGIWYTPALALNDSSAWSQLKWELRHTGPGQTCLNTPTTLNGPIDYDRGLVFTASQLPAVNTSGEFYTQFFRNDVVFEGRMYQVALRVGPGECARVDIGGTVFTADGNVNNGLTVGTFAVAPDDFAFTPARKTLPVRVEYWASSGGSRFLYFNLNPIADTYDNPSPFVPPCNWAQSTSGNNDGRALEISAARPLSMCAMRLRAYTRVPATLPTNQVATLEFWDYYLMDTDPLVAAQVGVREYLWNGTQNDWTWVTVRNGNTANPSWTLKQYDLSNFGGQDFRGREIEVAFRIDSRSAGGNSRWAIDDIGIFIDTIPLFTIPSSDDADTATPGLTWNTGCTWQKTTRDKYLSLQSYADNNGAGYTRNSDCVLATKGMLNLATYTDPGEPELNFWTKYDVSPGTQFTVEFQRKEDRGNDAAWTPLKPRNSSNAWIADGTLLPRDSGAQWEEKSISLNELKSGGALASPSLQYFFRFRLKAGNAPGVGVIVDEIKFRVRPSTLVNLPFYDPFDATTINDWTLGGQWQRDATIPRNQRSTPGALVDSNGTVVGAETIASLITRLNLVGTTNPKLEFWLRHDLDDGINFYVETQSDLGGDPWRIAWKYEPALTDDNQKNLAWRRIVVSLTNVQGFNYSGKVLFLRFRMNNTSAKPVDGVQIDDLRVWDDTAPYVTTANPFYDNIESQAVLAPQPSTTNWLAGGDWRLIETGTPGVQSRSGTSSWYSSNPAAVNRYPSPGTSTLEFSGTLDLNGVTDPVLSYWTKYSLNNTEHYLVAEAKRETDGEAGWTPLNWETNSTPFTTQKGTNNAWTRNLVVLSNTPFANQRINLRFRLIVEPLHVTTSPTDSGGWYLDDIYVGARNQLNEFLNYTETFTQGASDWTLEGNWQTKNDVGPWSFTPDTQGLVPTPYDFGNGTSTSLWSVNYYHFTNGTNIAPLDLDPEPAACALGVGSQISSLIVGGPAPVLGSGGSVNVTWSNGAPAATGTQNRYISTTGNGSSLSFNVPASVRARTVKVYVRLVQTGAGTGQLTVTPTLSDGSASATANVSPGVVSGAPVEYTYTVSNYRSSNPPETPDSLNIEMELTGGSNSGTSLQLRAVTLSEWGAVGAPALNLTRATTPTSPAIDLSNEGKGDWAAYGNNNPPGNAPDRLSCIKGVKYQVESVINEKWESANPPVGASPEWSLPPPTMDHQYFYAVYSRNFTVPKSGKFRFWVTSDDGFNIYIRPTLSASFGPPLTPKTTLGYPFISPSTNPYVPQGATEYFYEENIPQGEYIIQIRYFQNGGDGYIRFRSASDVSQVNATTYEANNIIRNVGSGNYPIGQRSAMYFGNPASTDTPTINPVSGGWSIPAGTKVRVRFAARLLIGGTGSAPDSFGVYTSQRGTGLGDGTIWTARTLQRLSRSGVDYGTTLQAVTLGFNKSDQSNNISPNLTLQNWDTYSIDLDAEAVPYVLNVKFNIDSTANFVTATTSEGWYIDNIQVIPN
jgi:Flp pilus assembly pilin Flp